MAAELGSFAEVARRLGYTEPAVHLHIAGLKKHAGGELFYRAGRRLILTKLGEELLPYAQGVMDSVDRMCSGVGAWHASNRHILRIGHGRSTGTYLYPYVAATLAETHPHLQVEPTIMPVDDIVDALRKRSIDLAIISSLRRRVRDISSPRYLVAAPLAAYHWTLIGRSEVAEELKRRDCVRSTVFVPEYTAQCGLITEIASHVSRFLVNPLFEISPNAEAAKANALAGRGLAYIPEYACWPEVRTGDLTHCIPSGSRQRSTVDIGHARPADHGEIASVVAALHPNKGILLRPPIRLSEAGSPRVGR
jgi:DNA-binding transcriptional LysR family regulator